MLNSQKVNRISLQTISLLSLSKPQNPKTLSLSKPKNLKSSMKPLNT